MDSKDIFMYNVADRAIKLLLKKYFSHFTEINVKEWCSFSKIDIEKIPFEYKNLSKKLSDGGNILFSGAERASCIDFNINDVKWKMEITLVDLNSDRIFHVDEVNWVMHDVYKHMKAILELFKQTYDYASSLSSLFLFYDQKNNVILKDLRFEQVILPYGIGYSLSKMSL